MVSPLSVLIGLIWFAIGMSITLLGHIVVFGTWKVSGLPARLIGLAGMLIGLAIIVFGGILGVI